MKLEDLLPTTAQLQLVHPVKGPLPIWLTVVGQDSKEFIEASAKVARTYMNAEKNSLDFNKQLQLSAEMAGALIVGWTDEEALGKWSPEKAIEHMSNPGLMWIREGVERFVRDRSNFFRQEPAAHEGVAAAQDQV